MRSGRYQARYVGPDLDLHTAGSTFETKAAAESWLSKERRLIEAETWTSPKARAEAAKSAEAVRLASTFGVFAEDWLEERDLRPTTRREYRHMLDKFILPTFGTLPLSDVTPALVRTWHAQAALKRIPTQRARCYSLLRTIFKDAIDAELVDANPCRVRGAGTVKRKHQPVVLTRAELEELAEAMPPKHRALTLLAGLCALRFGETAALRRSDVDLDKGTVTVARAVVTVHGKKIIGKPKTDAGMRTVHMPPTVVTAMRQHLGSDISGGRDGLIFPGVGGQPLASATLYGKPERRVQRADGTEVTYAGHGFYAARQTIGKPTLRWHDLRHTGLTLAAATGATTAELMRRAGHASPVAALRYQHAVDDGDARIAAKLDQPTTKGAQL